MTQMVRALQRHVCPTNDDGLSGKGLGVVSASREVRIPFDDRELAGDLTVPAGTTALIVFAHGSGSSRFSARNRQVARALQQRGFATLLLDLLTGLEGVQDEQTRHLRFNIPLLAHRLIIATDWVLASPGLHRLPVGYFGASTGAAAALIAAAERPESVYAVVSRGGRPDLAGDSLSHVVAPTLLIVGGNDPVVLDLNREALSLLHGLKQIEIIAGATHLFEEPGTLELAASLAGDWFARQLAVAAKS